MGNMTLDTFREELVAGIQRGTQDAVGKARLGNWLHNAMYEFGYALKFRELEAISDQTILADTSLLTIPADFRAMHESGIELYNVAGFEGKLIPETRDQYIQYNRTVVGYIPSGRPKKYHIYGTEFRVRPKTDVDYKALVHYWKTIPDLLSDDDVSIFQADWDDVILLGGLYRGFRHFNEFDRYQNIKNDFIGMVRSRTMREDLEEFPEGGINPVTYKDREDDSAYGISEDGTSEEFR